MSYFTLCVCVCVYIYIYIYIFMITILFSCGGVLLSNFFLRFIHIDTPPGCN